MGYGKPGGFVDKEFMSLQNAGCKRETLAQGDLVGQITAETSTNVCHNDRSPLVGKDYVFDYAAKRDQGIHERFPLKYQH